MANPTLRLRGNVRGDFHVDSTCIDCDAECLSGEASSLQREIDATVCGN